MHERGGEREIGPTEVAFVIEDVVLLARDLHSDGEHPGEVGGVHGSY